MAMEEGTFEGEAAKVVAVLVEGVETVLHSCSRMNKGHIPVHLAALLLLECLIFNLFHVIHPNYGKKKKSGNLPFFSSSSA